MTNMFKKTLIAAAIAGVSTSAMSAELHVTAVEANAEDRTAAVVTSQYLEVNDTVDLDTTGFDLILKLGANYTGNDVITLTFSGESLDTTSLPATVSADDGVVTNEVTLGLISTSVEDGNVKAIYRVTDVAGDTIGLEPNFGELAFDGAELGDGVSVSFEAETNTGLALDTSGGDFRSLDLISVADQFPEFDVTELDETIDVEEARLTFVGADTDDATFTVNNEAGDFTATLEGFDFTLNGNFGWLLDEEGDVINATAVTAACTGGTATEALAVTASALTISCDAATTDVDVAFDASQGPNEVSIPTQTFTYASTVSFSDGGTEEGSTALSGDAGAWDLNGSQVNVSYMPYRADISQVINLTNRSSQSGDVSVVAYPEDGGDAINLGVIATSEAGSVARITGAIIDGLSDETGVDHRETTSTTRYALEITTNAPAESIEVYSAYNVAGTGARLVVNDSNGGAVSKQ